MEFRSLRFLILSIVTLVLLRYLFSVAFEIFEEMREQERISKEIILARNIILKTLYFAPFNYDDDLDEFPEL